MKMTNLKNENEKIIGEMSDLIRELEEKLKSKDNENKSQ
jgi:hypothetical protein